MRAGLRLWAISMVAVDVYTLAYTPYAMTALQQSHMGNVFKMDEQQIREMGLLVGEEVDSSIQKTSLGYFSQRKRCYINDNEWDDHSIVLEAHTRMHAQPPRSAQQQAEGFLITAGLKCYSKWQKQEIIPLEAIFISQLKAC